MTYRNFSIRILILAICFLTHLSLTIGQEKIYVHTDSDYYIGGSTIHLSLYLTDKNNRLHSKNSTVVYVDLLNDTLGVELRTQIKLEDGRGAASLDLNPLLLGGHYILRSYTSHIVLNEDKPFRKSLYISGAKVFKSESDDEVFINFFPEGGKLIAGLTSQVAIKSVGSDGTGISTSMILYNSSKDQIRSVSTDQHGMGVVDLTPMADEHYYVMTSTSSERKYNLPEIHNKGCVLSIQNDVDHYIVKVSSAHTGDIPTQIILHRHGAIYKRYTCPPQLTFEIRIPLSSMEAGVSHVTALGVNLEPLAERLVYSSGVMKSLFFDVSLNKKDYTKRDKVELYLEGYNENGLGVAASMSISVRDMYLTQEIQNNHNIVSQYLLGSEIRGTIEHPLQYFDSEGHPNMSKIDLLLLTQGWRQFKESPRSTLLKERSLSLNGRTVDRRKPSKGVKSHGAITVFSEDFDMIPFSSDEDGYVHIKDIEIVGKVDLLIQSFKGEPKKVAGLTSSMTGGDGNILFILTDPIMLKTTETDEWYTHSAFLESVVPIDEIGIERMTQLRKNEAFDPIAYDIDIEEITIKSSKLPEVVQEYENGMMYSRPNTRVMADELPLLHQYTDVYDIIKNRVPGMRFDGPEDAGMKHSIILRGYSSRMTTNGTTSSTARFMVNGAAVSTQYAESIRPENMAFVDVISSLDKLTPYGSYGVNGLIMIYLNPPGTRTSLRPDKNKLSYLVYEGYNDIREFYAPIYNNTSDHDKPDNRAILYWHPLLETNEEGEVGVEFYTGDRNSIYQVTIEGMSKEGQPFIATSTFTVGQSN